MNPLIGGRDERVSRFLGDQIAASKYPGMQYVVVSANERIFEFAGGFSDVARRSPMEPTTTMMAYSMTKTFTAVAVLKLVEQGAVSLDESVVRAVPSFPYGPLVTVRHLLSQTSGLPNPIPAWHFHRGPDQAFMAIAGERGSRIAKGLIILAAVLSRRKK